MNTGRTDNLPGDGRPAELTDSLAVLVVFDKLEIGPVRLERRRLVAPYRLTVDGRMHETELIYRYEEAVFDPAEAESINLASMMAAQVALNYGLFCKEIIFHGLFDSIDQRFIQGMAENTAREIYVKKFLEPNPFLVGAAGELSPEKRKTYLHAKLTFPEGASKPKSRKWQMWQSRKDRYGILSSGGKDSLLSYGLMQEIAGQADHAAPEAVSPIFINESGRHWFTALNAYRHFQKTVPNTARVWVNSDRIFAWMLRHMPFIRKDFASIRADEYPVRLWTVAVFLFGALPLLRKRGIGRLLIGDEYDSSVRATLDGINHYDGLYDQSIYFDKTLTRYFMQKGWSVSQFSILRPLSEILIETILARRYPELLKLQMSCHAAHKGPEKIQPCGHCEKCRRIVGMLTAIGSHPDQCGYQDAQIERALHDLTRKGVHQETVAAEHLLYLLKDRGRIDVTTAKHLKFRERPEVEHMRFDSERSPLNAIPVDLREPLFRIYQEHTRGALQRKGHKWIAFNPLTSDQMCHPFPFEEEATASHAHTYQDENSRPQIAYWGELTWPEAAERLKKIDVALLPVGAIEQHGPHLPLDTDAFDAEYLTARVAAACSEPKPLVLPLIAYGVSYHHEDFSGTISIDNDTLSRLVYDIGMSVARNGIKKLVIINGHGGNSPALNYAAQMINRDSRIFVCVDTGETSDVDVADLIDTPNDVHAGEIETSTTLAVRPDLVKMDLSAKSVPRFSSRYLDFTSKRGVLWYAYTHKISESGIMGDSTKASAAKGKKIWEVMIAHLLALVEDLKHMTLSEIHHRRY